MNIMNIIISPDMRLPILMTQMTVLRIIFDTLLNNCRRSNDFITS